MFSQQQIVYEHAMSLNILLLLGKPIIKYADQFY